MAEAYHHPEAGFRELRLKGRDFISEGFTALTQRVAIALRFRFQSNGGAAMFRQNAALNLRHLSSSKNDATKVA